MIKHQLRQATFANRESPLGIGDGRLQHTLNRLWLCAQRAIVAQAAFTALLNESGICNLFTNGAQRLVKEYHLSNDSHKRFALQSPYPTASSPSRAACSDANYDAKRLANAILEFARSRRAKRLAYFSGLEIDELVNDAFVHMAENTTIRGILQEDLTSRDFQRLINRWASYYFRNFASLENRSRRRNGGSSVDDLDRMGISPAQTRDVRSGRHRHSASAIAQPSTSDVAIGSELGFEVAAYLERLPTKLHACVNERLAGFTVEEIARRKHVSRRTIYNWLSDSARLLGLRREGLANA